MIVNNQFVIFQGSHTALDMTYLNCISQCPTGSPSFQAAAWRSLKKGSAASLSISSRINFVLRSNNGLYNNALVATIMSPINILVNETKIINIPVGDADGDNLRCRWATQAKGINECGNVCPPNSLTPNTTIYPNCTIIRTGELVGDCDAATVIVSAFFTKMY